MKKVILSQPIEKNPNYVNALRALGATVVTDELASCGALVLTGGGDVHPRLYGQPADGARGVDEARDMYELRLIDYALASEMPVFGICRGAQLLNVAFGGTLRQHIDGHSQVGGVDTLHETRTTDAALCGLYGERFTVNSAHHQCVDRLGEGLRAVQWADDGTVEAIRHERLPIFAVQWHPERLCGALRRDGAIDGAAVLRSFLDAL